MASASGGDVVAPLLLFGGFIGLIYFLRWREVAAVRRGLEFAGATDARSRAVMFGGQVAEGTVQGRRVRYEIEQGGKNSPSHTTATTRAPKDPPFEMHLSQQSVRTARMVERGLEIDVNVGDPAFDDLVVVEAAPTDLARAVLDVSLRANILAHMPCTLSVSDGTIRFRKVGKLTAPTAVSGVVELLAAVEVRLGQAPQEVAASQARADGQGYRGADGAASALRDASALRELAHLREVRARQARRNRLFGAAILAVVFGVQGIIVYGRIHSASSSRSNSSPAAGASTPRSTTSAHHAKAPGGAPPASTVVHAPVPVLQAKVPAGAITPDVFCDAVAGIVGASRRAWCTPAEQRRPLTAHIVQESDTGVAACKSSLAASVAGGRVRFDPTAARACIDASYAGFAPPPVDASEHLSAALVAACKTVLVGSVAEGVACGGSLECVAGLSCGGKPGATTCRPPAAGGATCGVELDVLNPSVAPSAYQPWLGDNHLHDACVAGFDCGVFSNTCDPRAKKGEACTLLKACEGTLACRLGRCTDERGGEEGEPCKLEGYDNDCRAGLACTARTHTCGPRAVLVGLCQ